MITAELIDYIEAEILPRYDAFDKAHRRSHVITVIEQSMQLAQHYDVDPAMVYTIAAYHDTGLCKGREVHHTESARIVRNDSRLEEFFTRAQIETIADAVEDHRASNSRPPRTIYGMIVAEADRIIDGYTIMLRTIQYGLAHYTALTKEEHLDRAVQHLEEKYGHNGYLKLWIPQSANADRLQKFRKLIDDREELYIELDRIYSLEKGDVLQ